MRFWLLWPTNLPGWEMFARRILDDGGYQLWLSDSSAKLLSREIATYANGLPQTANPGE